MKFLVRLLLLLALALPAYGTTVTANLKSALTSNYQSDAFLRIRLRNYSGHVPRVVGTGVIVSPSVDVFPDSNGLISTPIYSNSDITPAGTYYTVEFWSGGRTQFSGNYSITGVTVDLNSAIQIGTPPTVAAPTGDTTYARLDGGNMPFTGSIATNSDLTVGDDVTVTDLVTAADVTATDDISVGDDLSVTDDMSIGGAWQLAGVDYAKIGTTNYFDIYSRVRALRPAPLAAQYPMGNDVVLQCSGPADCRLVSTAVQVTSSTSLTGGGGAQTITVASPVEVSIHGTTVLSGNATASFCNTAIDTNCKVWLAPDTTSEELVSYTIASGNTLTVTPANNHTQPFTVKQVGALNLDAREVGINNADSADRPLKLTDRNLNPIVTLTNDTSGTFPKSAIQILAVLTGNNGVNGDVLYRNRTSSSCVRLSNTANSKNIFTFCESGGDGIFGTDAITVAKSVTNDGGGLKHKRTVAGCTTGATVGATCTTIFSWATAFADASYTVSCFAAGVNSGAPILQAYTAKVAASTTVQTIALTAAAAQFANIECIAVHD